MVSSNIKTFSYIKKSQLLTVTFQNNRVYEYYSVPSTVFANLQKAASLGKYFHQHIRYKYKYKEI